MGHDYALNQIFVINQKKILTNCSFYPLLSNQYLCQLFAIKYIRTMWWMLNSAKHNTSTLVHLSIFHLYVPLKHIYCLLV